MQQMGLFSRVLALPSVRNPMRSIYWIALLYCMSGETYAIDLQTVLTNVSKIISPLTVMVLMISYAIGIYMVIHALTMMKKFGNIGTMQTQPGELGGPLLQLVIGAVLIYLPNATDTFMSSLFDTSASIFGYGNIDYQNLGTGSSLLRYSGGGGTFGQQWASLANTLVLYIQFLGLLSFIKGWLIMSKSAGHGSQQDSFTKALTHIIGGIIAMNFVGVVNIISNTIYGT